MESPKRPQVASKPDARARYYRSSRAAKQSPEARGIACGANTAEGLVSQNVSVQMIGLLPVLTH